MAAFYKLRLLTAQRGGEVASMRWQDVDLESAAGGRFPRRSSKNKLAHRVPLNASALRILKALKPADRRQSVAVCARGARIVQAQARAASVSSPKRRRRSRSRTSAATICGARRRR